MTLKAVVDSLDDIPEALQAEYQEKDGKFFLDLDSTISTHTAIIPLSTALASLKRDKAARDTKIASLEAKIAGLPDDFDPSKYTDVLHELEALKADPGRNQENEAALTRVREQYEQRIRNAETKRLADLAEKDATSRSSMAILARCLSLSSSRTGPSPTRASPSSSSPRARTARARARRLTRRTTPG